jgi:hypothetical protein
LIEVLHEDVLDEALLLGDLGLERPEHVGLDAEILLRLADALHGDVPEVRRVVGHEREVIRLRRAWLSRGRRRRPRGLRLLAARGDATEGQHNRQHLHHGTAHGLRSHVSSS